MAIIVNMITRARACSEDPLADEQPSISDHHLSESRNKLFHQSRVPAYLDITYPACTYEGGGYPAHTMCVWATATRGAKLSIELNDENLNYDGCAYPPPPMHRLLQLVEAS